MQRFSDARNHFVTLSSNNYKFFTFPQIPFYILFCHILFISLYYISTLFFSSIQNPNDSFLPSRYLLLCSSNSMLLGEPRHDNVLGPFQGIQHLSLTHQSYLTSCSIPSCLILHLCLHSLMSFPDSKFPSLVVPNFSSFQTPHL